MDKREFLKLAALGTLAGISAAASETATPDKNRRALLVIDVQNEYFEGGKLPISYPPNSMSNITDTIKAAQNSAVPVVMIQHTSTSPEAKAFVKGTHGWELHESVAHVQAEHYVEKTMPSSFVRTDLEEWLRANGIGTVTICGYMTQHCCDTTARYAHHLGFNVEFLSDATGTRTFENYAGKVEAEELHRATLVEQAFRFSNVISTQEWIDTISVKI